MSNSPEGYPWNTTRNVTFYWNSMAYAKTTAKNSWAFGRTNLKSAMSRTRVCCLRPKIHNIWTRIGPFSGPKIRYFPDRHMGELPGAYCDLEICQGDVMSIQPIWREVEDCPTTCMLLEHCGDPCNDDLRNLDLSTSKPCINIIYTLLYLNCSLKILILEQFLALDKRACIIHCEAV